MLEITIRCDGEVAAHLHAEGPRQPNPSLYGSGWDRFSVRYVVGEKIIFEDDIHARPEEGYLGLLARVRESVRRHPALLFGPDGTWR